MHPQLLPFNMAYGPLEEEDAPFQGEAEEPSGRNKVMLFGVDLASSALEQSAETTGHDLNTQTASTNPHIKDSLCLHEHNEQAEFCLQQHIDLGAENELERSVQSTVTSCRQDLDDSRLEILVPDGRGSVKPLETVMTCDLAPQKCEKNGRKFSGKRKLKQTLIFRETFPRRGFQKDRKTQTSASSKKQRLPETEYNPKGSQASPDPPRLTETINSSRVTVVNLSAVSQRDRWWLRVKQVLDSPGTTIVFGLRLRENTGTADYSSLRKLNPSQRKIVLKQRRAVSKITETENERTTNLEDSMDKLVGVGFILSFPSEVDFEPEQLQLCDQLFYVDFDEESSSTGDLMVRLEERLIHSELDSYELSDLTSKSFPVFPLPEAPGNPPPEAHDIAEQRNTSESLKQDLEASKTLFETLQVRMQGLEDAFRRELKLTVILAHLELDGVGLDVPYLQSKRALLEDLKLHEKLQHGGDGKIRGKRKSKSEKHATTSEAVLTNLVPFHELPGIILETVSTVTAQAHSSFQDDSTRIHSKWNSTGTATGRISSSEPNLQNIPRYTLEGVKTGEDDASRFGIKIREAFVAQEGSVLVSADYSQMELRLAAHLSDDRHIISILRSVGEEGDVFRMIASHWMGKQVKDVTEEERQTVKRISYGILYGQGRVALSASLKVSPHEAERLMDNFLKHFPTIRAFINQVKARVRLDGFVTMISGRKRMLPDIRSSYSEKRAQAERQAVNSLIQGSASDIVKAAMIAIDDVLRRGVHPNVKLVMQMHDELLFEVPEGHVDLFSTDLRKLMERVQVLKVPLLVNIRTGKRWGSMSLQPHPNSGDR
ncbi:DNA polymerase I superfamily [Klebsormidium nitens]|uniref:DNA-directed DNA polymerase n=1 Tax=Klebsormidium nitens TaxID=105231 RepID=A0A1Y1IUA3_KLENI|nr:DNA polymerase I superfamily [Klebsormidium nitens]|eukprot:GAQ91778.1 DNA polymerase I superfamily [Klebsormidium nitens]